MLKYMISGIVSAIIDILKRLWFELRNKQLKESKNQLLKEVENDKQKSDKSYTDFKSEYDKYKRERDEM